MNSRISQLEQVLMFVIIILASVMSALVVITVASCLQAESGNPALHCQVQELLTGYPIELFLAGGFLLVVVIIGAILFLDDRV